MKQLEFPTLENTYEQGENVMVDERKFKQIIRPLDKQGVGNPLMGTYSADGIDEYVSSYLNSGWKVQSVHYLGSAPEAWHVLYVLVRE